MDFVFGGGDVRIGFYIEYFGRVCDFGGWMCKVLGISGGKWGDRGGIGWGLLCLCSLCYLDGKGVVGEGRMVEEC